MPSDFQFKEPPPPYPSEFQKAIHGFGYFLEMKNVMNVNTMYSLFVITALKS